MAVGDELLAGLRDVLSGVNTGAAGPQPLAKTLGVDKVLTSRVLKAMRSRDPMAAAFQLPGPDPLRRLIRAAARRGVDEQTIARAEAAVDRFEALIRDQVGDRSLLDTILSAWIPSARREFELRRKQSVFKALSQLRGMQTRCILATAVLAPSADGEHIDVVWINGLIGIHRVRPGVSVKLATRRMDMGDAGRMPKSLAGTPIEEPAGLLLREFCSDPLPTLDVHTSGQTVYYLLGENGFGARSAADLVFAEVNRGELPRFVASGSGRKAYFFAEASMPAENMQFDVLVHRDLYAGQEPRLYLYDTSFEGVASVNDARREVDRLDMAESIEPLGNGLTRVRSEEVPRYAELVRHVFRTVGVDESAVRGFRCRIDYPLYGSQVTMAFDGVERA